VIVDTTTRMSWFVYVVRTADGIDRNEMIPYLQENGVPSRPYFTPIHLAAVLPTDGVERRRSAGNGKGGGYVAGAAVLPV